jgi:hypothetical protein
LERAQGAGGKIAKQFCVAAAQGIAAKILFYRFAVKKIAAESPVFLPA